MIIDFTKSIKFLLTYTYQEHNMTRPFFSKGDKCPRYIPYLRAANSSPIPQECDIVNIRNTIIRKYYKRKGQLYGYIKRIP
jgi:hypothetical protein